MSVDAVSEAKEHVVNCAMHWRAVRGASWEHRQMARLALLQALSRLDAAEAALTETIQQPKSR